MAPGSVRLELHMHRRPVSIGEAGRDVSLFIFQVQWSRREWEGVKLHHLHHGGSIANVGLILF